MSDCRDDSLYTICILSNYQRRLSGCTLLVDLLKYTPFYHSIYIYIRGIQAFLRRKGQAVIKANMQGKKYMWRPGKRKIKEIKRGDDKPYCPWPCRLHHLSPTEVGLAGWVEVAKLIGWSKPTLGLFISLTHCGAQYELDTLNLLNGVLLGQEKE